MLFGQLWWIDVSPIYGSCYWIKVDSYSPDASVVNRTHHNLSFFSNASKKLFQYIRTFVQQPPSGPQICGRCWRLVVVQLYHFVIDTQIEATKWWSLWAGGRRCDGTVIKFRNCNQLVWVQLEFQLSLRQGSQTRGPRAACGLPKVLMRPANNF